ncbi:head GIN domain-containing protein [Bizionia arctica]|uniref:Lipoprotein n=1 Tax=Bizionia arctica TaxID=1495645 RepID=A0A917GWE1_9FLAO|nr:head GIN domain-containing protein [Bizionia arctica]GGG58433.1 lipoprotein [Bizionia arctica]
MSTLTKISASIILAILMMSCNFDMGVKGNGEVSTKERALNESFNAVKVSRGLDLYLTQSNAERLTVEADENLHDIITTTIENNVLVISTSENIGRSTSKKIHLNFKNLQVITATSGSEVYSTNTIKATDLELDSTSGSDMELNIHTDTVICNSTSGSDMELSGKTTTFIAEASSGSSIEAEDLESINAQVVTSSGGDIVVNTQELTAKASSGGDIRYIGNPNILEKSDGVSGTIKRD